jgi:Tfp pilus assembly protein PilO
MSTSRANLVVLSAVLVLAAVFTFCFFIPGSRKLAQRRSEISSLASDVQSNQQAVGDISAIYAEIQRLDAEMRDFREHIPDERRFGEFLSSLSDILKAEGIENYAVQPQLERPLGETDVPCPAAIARDTVVLPVGITFESSFTQLFNFLTRVERLARLSHVDRVLLGGIEQNPGHVQVELVLHTYYKPHKPAELAAAGAAP